MSHDTKESLNDYWTKYRPATSPAKSLFYRFENEGIIVYDSKARISDEPSPQSLPQKEPAKAKNKLDVMDGEEYDINQYIHMKSYNPFKFFPQDYTLVIPENSLRFDSKFESGNLQKAVRVSESEYNLYVEYDTETLGYTQWFYFSVRNNDSVTVRFNIVNFVKYDSLYNKGMKPLVLSSRNQSNGWTRDCSSVSYYKNSLPRGLKKSFYTLTFSYTFKDPQDRVYFAYSFPYTYTDLNSYLEKYQISLYSSFVRIDTLSTSLAGNPIPILTITKSVQNYTPWEEELEKLKKSAAGRKALRSKIMKEKTQSFENKRCVFLTARVHPGETNGSFMMKGFLDFITGKSAEAKQLRKNFVFKVVPMMNPDGVVYGNYRCSLLGVDLNRRWKRPNKLMHPEIYYCKRLIQMISEEKEITVFCDMHGHSIKKDVFMYGCRHLDDRKQDIMIKILPYLIEKKNKIFSYKKSIFRIGRDKESTGRVVCFQHLGVRNSYTMEASFFGPSSKAAFDNKTGELFDVNFDRHFEVKNLEKIGKDFGKVLTALINPREFSRVLKKFSLENERTLKKEESDPEKPAFENYESYLAENVIEELCLDDSGDSHDCSDSEGSENDDKRVQFKKEKQKRAKILEKCAEEKVSEKATKKTKKKNETIKKDANFVEKKREEDGVKVVRDSPVFRYRTPVVPRTSNTIIRPSIKFAAAVALPKESNLFRREERNAQSLPERKIRSQKYRKYDLCDTKLKFKEMIMYIEERNAFKFIV